MPGIAPVLGLSQAKRVRLVDRLALRDHVLYGLVLSDMRCRPHGWPRLGSATVASVHDHEQGIARARSVSTGRVRLPSRLIASTLSRCEPTRGTEHAPDAR